MLGSPNFFRGVYDGCGAAADIRNQSATITQMYVEYFDKEGLAWDFTEVRDALASRPCVGCIV